MVSIIEIDLAVALALKDRLDLSRNGRLRAIAEVTLSPADRAAFLASNQCRVGDIIGPFQDGVTGIATE
jgi:hypothetical protein